MPTIADYSIVVDGHADGTKMPLTWIMPANVNTGSRAVLTFMFFTGKIGEWMKIRGVINGSEVLQYTFGGRFIGTIQEVIPKGLLKANSANELTFEFEWDDSLDSLSAHAWVSDVVIYWQANI